MWRQFYRRTVNVVDKHKDYHLAKLQEKPKFSALYNIYGFAYAFKVCHNY